MAQTDLQQDCRYLVVGLGKSGLSSIKYLVKQGYDVVVTDSRQSPPGLEQLQKEYPQIRAYIGGFAAEAFESAECIVVSPGVSIREPLIAESRARGAEIIGDIELFARHAKAPVVAITGSNGKSTVTALVGEMAKTAELDVRVGGNIGTPALDLLLDTEPDLYVLELSSFQLETTNSLDAKAAAILNISEDHMDRYENLSEYAAAKAKVYHGSGVLVVNLDDVAVMKIVSVINRGRKTVGFTLNKPGNNQFGIIREDDNAWLGFEDNKLIAVNDVRIKGWHNMANALAALALGKSVGIDMQAMLQALQTFPGLPHRCQWVAEINGVNWFNDSKATNVGAALASINGTPARKMVLLAGGQGKGQDFAPLAEALANRESLVILFGEDANKIAKALSPSTAVVRVTTFAEAIQAANQSSLPGDVVLLAPACASFDMFNGYEHRGSVFTEMVKRLAP